MLHVIINEGLYDKEFVEKWTFGFDELKERVQQYPPSKAAEITWVAEAKLIIEAARMFCHRQTGGLQWGVPVDMCPGGNSTAQAIAQLVEHHGQYRCARRQRHRPAVARRHHLPLHHRRAGLIFTGRSWSTS